MSDATLVAAVLGDATAISLEHGLEAQFAQSNPNNVGVVRFQRRLTEGVLNRPRRRMRSLGVVAVAVGNSTPTARTGVRRGQLGGQLAE
jgi:hypothetical protein